MVQELAIHVGDHKTGSTALQSALAEGRVRLDGAEIAYLSGLNDNPLAKTLMVKKPDPKVYGPLFARRARQLDRNKARYGVISAEHFEYVDPRDLGRALDAHLPQYRDRTRLLAYLRPHADRFVASFAERTKIGTLSASMAEFFDRTQRNGMITYRPRMEAWLDVFGARLSVRPYVRGLLRDGDIVADFADWLGGGASFEVAPGRMSNSTLTVESLAIMRAFHARLGQAIPDFGRAHRAFGWNLGPLLAEVAPEGTRLGLDRALARRLVAASRADADWIDGRFFPEDRPLGQALDRVEEKSLEAPQSLELQDNFGPSERRLIEAWIRMTVQVVEADPGHFMWAIRPPEVRPPRPKMAAAAVEAVQAQTSRLPAPLERRLRQIWRRLRYR